MSEPSKSEPDKTARIQAAPAQSAEDAILPPPYGDPARHVGVAACETDSRGARPPGAPEAREDKYERGYREAERIGLRHLRSVLLCLDSFRGDAHFAVRCMMVAHGMWSAMPERDQVEIANHFRCERANVNKLVKQIQKRLGLPPTLGQRSQEGCENMSKVRRSQLHEKHNRS